MINKTFSKRQIQLSRTCLFIWMALSVSFWFIYCRNSYYSNEQQICFSKYPPFVLGIVSLGDLIIILTICILLCRALLTMTPEHVQNEYTMLKKFVLLSVIATITTQTALMFTLAF